MAGSRGRRGVRPPRVRLGQTAPNGIAPSIYALVERGAQRRPALVRDIRGTVEVRFEEGFAPVRIAFDRGTVVVEDGAGDGEAARADLVIRGALPDIVQLAAAPLVGGLPKPTDARGRAALARIAGGRVRLEGSPRLARRLLTLLQI